MLVVAEAMCWLVLTENKAYFGESVSLTECGNIDQYCPAIKRERPGDLYLE